MKKYKRGERPKLTCGTCGATFTARGHRVSPLTANYCGFACRLAATKKQHDQTGAFKGWRSKQ